MRRYIKLKEGQLNLIKKDPGKIQGPGKNYFLVIGLEGLNHINFFQSLVDNNHND